MLLYLLLFLVRLHIRVSKLRMKLGGFVWKSIIYDIVHDMATTFGFYKQPKAYKNVSKILLLPGKLQTLPGIIPISVKISRCYKQHNIAKYSLYIMH